MLIPGTTPTQRSPALLRPQEGAAYAEAWLSVLKNVSKDETVEYTLALIEQAFAGAAAFTAP